VATIAALLVSGKADRPWLVSIGYTDRAIMEAKGRSFAIQVGGWLAND
jgi:hypothetical protein